MKIVTVDQMRDIERRSEEAGVSTAELMEYAGRSVADEVLRCLGDPAGRRVLILVGPGNNGGDGLVAARHLHDAGASVAIYLWHRDLSRDGHYEVARSRGIAILRAEEDPDRSVLRNLLSHSALVVDALLGTGRARPVSGDLKSILDTVNSYRRPDAVVLAVDLPTGMNADTGAADESCLRADLTVTLGLPKVGLYAFPGAAYAGRVVVGDIGLPRRLADDVDVELATRDAVRELLPARPIDAHKGTFGKAMVVGGCANYLGAPVLACLAAGRVGAGLVTLACAHSLLPIFGAKLTEATFLPLPDSEGSLGPATVGPLCAALGDYTALVLGPGLGRADQTVAFVRWALARLKTRADLRCLIDADGLNALAAADNWPDILPPGAVLTPHAGELARLLRTDTVAVNADRLGHARQAAAQTGAILVLKGAFTIVAHPDGRATINPYANPALASAGTGDVLAGAIGGLLAQHLDPYHAAVAGVFLHSQAGALVSADLGQAGLLAGDLLPALPRAISALRSAARGAPQRPLSSPHPSDSLS